MQTIVARITERYHPCPIRHERERPVLELQRRNPFRVLVRGFLELQRRLLRDR